MKALSLRLAAGLVCWLLIGSACEKSYLFQAITWDNRTDIPLVIMIDGKPLGAVRPFEKIRSLSDLVPIQPPVSDTVYRVEAAEFVPGPRIVVLTSGKDLVYGGPGRIVFSRSMSWQELKAQNWTVVISLQQ